MNYVFVTGIYPPEIGGPATVISDTVASLRASGHTCTVITYGEPRPDVVAVSRNGNVLRRYWRCAQTIRRALSSDATVVSTDVFSVGIPTRLALLGLSHRWVIRLGGEWAWEDAVNRGASVTLRSYWNAPTDRMRWMWKSMLMRWVLCRAERIVVTSDLLREPIRALGPALAMKCTVAMNVVSCAPTSRRVGAVHDPIRLVYVGRYAPVKHVLLLADICRLLVARGVSYHLTCIGSGPDEVRLREACQGLNVTFLPPMRAEELAQVWMEQDVHVLPSWTDVCPNSIVEALSFGVPCVMTSEHGFPKPVPGTVECDPSHADTWAEEIRRLTDPEVYATLQAEAQPLTVTTETFLSQL